MSLPGFTWQCALKYTGIKLQKTKDQDPFLTRGKDMHGGISGLMVDRFVESTENRKSFHIGANNLYG